MTAVLNALIPVIYIGFSVAEARWPALPLARGERFRRATGALFFLMAGAIMANVPRLWSGQVHLLSLSWLGTAGGAMAGLIATNVVNYAWHRARHRVPLLWRLLHQLHHSSERLDVASAFYFHPLDVAGTAALIGLTTALLGITADAAALCGLVSFTIAVLTHANLRTPCWLGYVVQRPEAHSIHHARGVHAFNYADLPIIDMLFGTFRNPERPEELVGFWPGASRRLAAMLVGVRVSASTLSPRAGS